MTSSKLRGWACAASLLAAATLSAYAQPSVVASTVPGNGDVNPYGIARVPRSTGALVQGFFARFGFRKTVGQILLPLACLVFQPCSRK